MRRAVLTGALAILFVSATPPPLSISLQTAWQAPPLLLEILETVCDENPSAYFPLLHLASIHLPSNLSDVSHEDLLIRARDIIISHELLPKPSSLSTFDLALALHTAVPRIQAFYSYYEDYVNEASLGVVECGSWVEWRGKGFCDSEDLRKDLELSIEGAVHHPDNRPSILPFDHIFRDDQVGNDSPFAIFYYDSGSPASASLLYYLAQHSRKDPAFRYVVRYRPSIIETDHEAHTTLSGYGVEMVLKKTDYLVVDDRSQGDTKPVTSSGHDIRTDDRSGPFTEALGEVADEAAGITKDELKLIGLKAATLIKSSSDPLDALQHLSQDFPKYSAAIADKISMSEAIQSKVPNMMRRGPSGPAFYINGKVLTEPELNAFSLLSVLRTERDLVLDLTSLGLTPKQAVDLISDPMIGETQIGDEPGEGVVDASDRIEGEGVITWWNDIEKDKRYQQWPAALQAFLRPLYPGQFHQVRRNAFNIVFVLDLSLGPSLDAIATSISTMIQRGLPFRFGVVPMYNRTEDSLSLQMAKLFLYSVKTFGRGATKNMLQQIVSQTPSTAITPGIVNLSIVRQAYEAIADGSDKPSLPFDTVIASNESDIQLRLIDVYNARLKATIQESPAGHLFVNGKHAPMTGAWTVHVQNELQVQIPFLQEQIAIGNAPEDVSTFFYDLPSASPRRNKLIVPTISDNKLKVFNLLDLFKRDSTHKLESDFIYTDSERGAPISMWVVGDLDSPEGRRVVRDALRHLQTPQCSSRLGFIHVPSVTSTALPGARLSTVIYQLLAESALSRTTPASMLQLLDELDSQRDNVDQDGRILQSEDDDPEQAVEGSPLNVFSSEGWSAPDTAAAAEFWKVGTAIKQRLGLRSDLPHLMVNGRLVGPLTPATFSYYDLDALEVYELRKRVKRVIDVLNTMYNDLSAFDRPTLARLISTASSVVATAYKSSDEQGIFIPSLESRNRYYERFDDGVLSFTVGDPDTALIRAVAIVDPISEQAQKWSHILKVLSEMENVSVSVHLEPETIVSEMKLKRFYRYALSSKMIFDVDGNEVTPGVTFGGLPSKPIFTLGLDTPPSWIVSPKTSPYDLDNLVLSQFQGPVHVLFTLKQLLIEGHGREANNAPPRGLQLQLTKNGLEVAGDTQVMANLGYFQFRATPGVYDLAIRPGRGFEVYDLESVGNEGWDSLNVTNTGTGLALVSFEGKTIFPRFTRKPGMEKANVLVEEVAAHQESIAENLWTQMKSFVGLNKLETLAVSKNRHADINIFTVASGLLYERFASIMILSVMKHTSSSVKFWFIENFLSPSFLKFIPHLAEEYGFQYELVTYKWPHWLRAQTEKQRIIWAYKILFLDVLFPMDLDKVIFVDADQIVRVDMKELVDVDLHGKVYGYAPMGDDREEMEGFRFWKTGYWKDALRGKPYHISALYVVDLKRFRQLATGDRLRGQYHALSADPNSLANLDQDLPNSMQDSIPIHTLNEDWLWCQTWCSDERLSRAKTIDLCQNPLTKEPKLVRARQIPEWDSYDREIAALAARLSGETGGLAASVDDLASDKSVVNDVVSEDSVANDTELESGIEVENGEEGVDEDDDPTGHLEDEL
ncbi:UDP-glucose:Glyco protein glucosyltransferase-domain-containing protein [Naematelia encephala]|uniref:UDP-glucose:Glyco protein glucosyltransferase-domain-containing protein n=1 Tax=Naematelia encephala TaxID=71784 RepID=A0A1Y2BCF5_9TREE|nr:UDP-glucose:Glyco protein glucosyltransferase-domain-containing protein [Naematelia encephala]